MDFARDDLARDDLARDDLASDDLASDDLAGDVKKLQRKSVLERAMSAYMFYTVVLNKMSNPDNSEIPEDISHPYFQIIENHKQIQKYFEDELQAGSDEDGITIKNVDTPLWKQLEMVLLEAVKEKFIVQNFWPYEECGRCDDHIDMITKMLKSNLGPEFWRNQERDSQHHQEVINICATWGKFPVDAGNEELTTMEYFDRILQAASIANLKLADFYTKMGAFYGKLE